MNADCTTDASRQRVVHLHRADRAGQPRHRHDHRHDVDRRQHRAPSRSAKRWADTTPPVTACTPGVNPAGHEPKGSNEDGFWRLLATDAVDPNPQIFVVDSGTGTIFGPYPNGTNIKYTEANGATPSASPGSGAVDVADQGPGRHADLSPWMAPATSRSRCSAWSRRRPSRTRLTMPGSRGAYVSTAVQFFSSASLGDGRRDPPSIDVAGPRSHDRERRHHFLQLAIFEKECGIARVAALRLPRGERLIKNATARFHDGSQRREQRPVEIVEHQHSVAGLTTRDLEADRFRDRRPRLPASVQDARRCRERMRSRPDRDRWRGPRSRRSPAKGMTAAAAGNIEDLAAARQQIRVLDQPRRWTAQHARAKFAWPGPHRRDRPPGSTRDRSRPRTTAARRRHCARRARNTPAPDDRPSAARRERTQSDRPAAATPPGCGPAARAHQVCGHRGL